MKECMEMLCSEACERAKEIEHTEKGRLDDGRIEQVETLSSFCIEERFSLFSPSPGLYVYKCSLF